MVLYATSRRRVEDVYELGPELGRGSFGVVRRVKNRVTGREYAMKTLQLVHDLGAEAYSNLRNEIQVMKLLDHPSIVRLYETYTSARRRQIFLVMELCDGGTLSEQLPKKEGRHEQLPKRAGTLSARLEHLPKRAASRRAATAKEGGRETRGSGERQL